MVNAEGRTWAERLTKALEREFVAVSAADFDPETEADLIVYSCAARSRSVQHRLNVSRELRCPYIILTPAMHYPAEGVLNNVLAPVTMLEEEVHKAELLSHLARYTGAAITLLTAHDYGSRAQTNTDKIHTFLCSRQEDLGMTFHIDRQTAKSDSMSLYKEVPAIRSVDAVVWTASRDYGLDDIIFGPAERKIILHSVVPIILLNPRGDLYSLCD